MIGPQDVLRWAESFYDDFLRSLIEGGNFFSTPRRWERLGRVPANEDPTEFLRIATPLWDGSKEKRGFGYVVVLEERRRRSRGLQNEPVAVAIPTRDDYLNLIGKQAEVKCFEADLDVILERMPNVRKALMSKPRLVVTNHGAWSGVLEVVDYLCRFPRPGCYVRALPVSVPTKFIEGHESAIEALLAVLPESGYCPELETFEDRCGFLSDESSIRGRLLCANLQCSCGLPVADLELRVSGWNSLILPQDAQVIVCENKANFLALPAIPNTLALFGQGSAAVGNLPKIRWLASKRIIYWGDIDPCGFYILSLLRRAFPSARSVLMDKTTLEKYRGNLSAAKMPPTSITWSLLRPEEESVARELLETHKGVEQEKLLFAEGLHAIFGAQADSNPPRDLD